MAVLASILMSALLANSSFNSVLPVDNLSHSTHPNDNYTSHNGDAIPAPPKKSTTVVATTDKELPTAHLSSTQSPHHPTDETAVQDLQSSSTQSPHHPSDETSVQDLQAFLQSPHPSSDETPVPDLQKLIKELTNSLVSLREKEHIIHKAFGCQKTTGICWTRCIGFLGIFGVKTDWCYSTKSYSQSYNYVYCDVDEDCEEQWSCASVCSSSQRRWGVPA